MRATAKAVFALLGLAAVWPASIVTAAPLDCRSRALTLTEATICQDSQLLRTDAQIDRRFTGFARRLSFGQYLGLRQWQAQSTRQRESCGGDRVCITAHYRGQARFLDRLQQCLDNTLSRRNCLRGTMRNDQEALRR